MGDREIASRLRALASAWANPPALIIAAKRLEEIADRLEAGHPEREGWVAVPRGPTEAMCVAFLDAEDASLMIDPLGAFEDGYAAMLSAAPKP